jgi:hypothetical protein
LRVEFIHAVLFWWIDNNKLQIIFLFTNKEVSISVIF